MGDTPLPGKGPAKKPQIAKPVHLQRLEAALDVRPFVNQVERILNSEVGSESAEDSDCKVTGNEISKGDKIIHGVVTTKQERQCDRLRLYNFASVGQERLWLRSVLLSSDSETSSDEESPAGKNRRIKRLLKERAGHNKHANDYYRNAGNSHYMYYGTGLLSTVDRYGERAKSRPQPQFSGRGRRGRPSDRPTRGMPKGRRGRPCGTQATSMHNHTDDRVEVKVDWEERLANMKEENDPDEFNATNEKTSARGRKKLSTLKTPEALTARRRRHWQLMVKKELGKVQRARAANHKEMMLQRKRLATLCCKHWRHAAMQSQKNMKETVWRCKRLSREMQAYWKRYDRAERETRRRMEKEAEEQRKMDVELMEAKRQRRKLNFLITQTELYAHFMQRKMCGDDDADDILRQLDEDKDPRLVAVDHYDSEEMKARAARNARDAFNAETARKQQFDAAANAIPIPAPTGDYDQPDIFRGTLKGYQLKGMNWLASLYDQGISGILADEMGLGKTVQCIAFLCHVAERLGVWGPFLVVSPASTLHNWQQEMERFVPDFKVVPYWGSPSERKILRQFWERKDLHTSRAAFHVVITSYQIVVSDCKYLNRVAWQYMILDEAQAIKSAASVRWKLLLGFTCRNRLLLSGTPIQNSMAELWALLHFIMPTLFDSHEEFNEWFSKDIESHAENKSTMDEKHLSRLHMILKPFMLRRIKKDVENELSDKIEIMVHCPLTIRQRLLYLALKKKIKIEELLHFTIGGESGHNADKNFTSNLMNLVMQFRKVCNHPELFERRDVRSPFSLHVDDYHIPKVVAETAILVRCIPSKRHLLYNMLSILTADYVYRNCMGDGCFAFSRFIDLSPSELYGVTLCGWLFAMKHLEESQSKFELLRHRQAWWYSGEDRTDCGAVQNKHLLLICADGDVLKRRKCDSLMWEELLFCDPLWIEGGPFLAYADHIIHYMPETIEHRGIRTKYLRKNDEENVQADIAMDIASTFPHVERASMLREDQVTRVPQFMVCTTYKVCSDTPRAFAASREFAYSCARHAHCDSARGARLVAQRLASCRPPHGWATLQLPDKNQLVSDAGKLTVLDSLLKKLKERGHRVLIYSQMTKMIDLLEEYMWHRKHKYMRLDGSSKISARRDMVADFQARADIFVFLLSTRAGGLGINLTAADTVIFYDSDWNPTVDQQAMDRAHRLGQTKQVTVYRLICKGTIEERIMQRAREKSEIQRMVISGGNFKPDTLKPKEVVSLLLDDEEIELKYRQKSEEKKLYEERERKRKPGLLPNQSAPSEAKRVRESPSEPGSPLQVDDDCDKLVVDISPHSTPGSFSPPHRPTNRLGNRTNRGGGGSRRGRPRTARLVTARSNVTVSEICVQDQTTPESEYPLDPSISSVPGSSARRGPGRPRLRSGTAPARGGTARSGAVRGGTARGGTARGGTARGADRARRPRRVNREPLLVPLAPPP